MSVLARLLASVTFLSVLCSASVKAGGVVWVFGERQFPAAGSAAPVAPRKLVGLLKEQGVDARTVDAAGLEAAALLENASESVVVLGSGNVFPKNAFVNLQQFHKQGGNFVLTGVPFSHPCERTDGKWKDLGHQDLFSHREKAIGTGGFHSARPGQQWSLKVPENPLLLPENWFAGMEGRGQWLDVGSLDPKDEVVPLFLNSAQGQVDQPVAALIRHRCELFSGACDVWLGHMLGGEDEKDEFLATQLLMRGVLWCLHEKKQMPAENFRGVLTELNRKEMPRPLPGGLLGKESPMPWGDSFVPKSGPPARQLAVVSLHRASPAARVALGCLQGLTCRTEPRIWLIHTDIDRFWLDWHQKQGHIDGYREEEDWASLFHKHKGEIKGAILPDAELYRGDLLAANVAACEDWIVASPQLAAELGLEVRMDLRGRFKTYAEGLDWLWANYKDRLNAHMCDYMHPARLLRGNFAYAYQWKAPMVWISGREEQDLPGVDRGPEKRAVARIFSEMPVNIPIFGFPAAGEGVGIGEPPGVALASRYGKGLVCTDHMLNAGVMSGVKIASLHQTVQPPAPVLQKDKIYVALVMSDGDNQNAWHAFFRNYFESPSHGKYPLAFGIGPAIRELQPAVAQWYYQRASPTTEFIADVSGASYMQPDHWGEAYTNKSEVLSGFLRWTEKLLPPLGLRTVRTVHGDNSFLAEYAKTLPFCHSLFADMGCYSGYKGYQNLTYQLPGGMPVFRAVTTWRNFGTGFMGEIREQVGAARPAFVNGFVHCWTFQPKDLDEIVKNADSDIVFVTPTQLAALYRQANPGALRNP